MSDQESLTYLEKKIQPLLKSLTIDILILKPPHIITYMIQWLETNSQTILLEKDTTEITKNSQKNKVYILKYIDPIYENMLVEIIEQKPSNLINFMTQWCKENKQKYLNEEHPESEEEGSDDDIDENDLKKKKNTKQIRQGVSSEVYGLHNNKKDFKPRLINKSEAQEERILKRLSQAFMFSSLEPDEKKIVIGAMEERSFNQDEFIIKQGDDGNELFIVDQGKLECSKIFSKGQEAKILKTYHPGDSFGELALLYNVPRAATIKALTNSICWVLDRDTFNNVVKTSQIKKRERYEEFLGKVEILKSMDPYERNQLTDALQSQIFQAGEFVFKQGSEGDKFYMIEEGKLVAIKDGREVFTYDQVGQIFGELALMNNAKRAASIQCVSNCKLVYLDRLSFKRLLGPIDEILKRNQETYLKYMQ